MKDFKKIEDIVTFYKSIERANLFKNEEFTSKESSIINQDISKTNKKYITFLRERISTNKINVKSLQAIVNELLEFYNELYSDIFDNLIPEIEQTPLFRYEISPDHKALKTGYSAIAVSNNLADLINQLKNDYPNDIKLEEKLKWFSHPTPYIDIQSYHRHIYFKMISPDFLSNECYNNKEKQAKKINEFLEIFTDNPLHLPISFDNIKDEPSKADETDKYIQEINDSHIFINQALELFPDEINITDFKNNYDSRQNENDKTVNSFSNINSFITLTEQYKYTKKDYIKDLFFSIKDHHKFIDNKTNLTDFRELFKACNLSKRIILLDHLKFYALLRFLREKHIIKTSKNYLELFTELFVLKENIEVEYKSLQGSKTTLTLKEESQINQIFK
jgi:hypothetical protein